MKASLFAVAVVAGVGDPAALAAPHAALSPVTIKTYVRPYVNTNNFSGVILVARKSRPLFNHAFGYANFALRRPNTIDTKFHIASMSMQYTAAATMRLIMAGNLKLDTPVSEYVPELPNSDRITVGNLLTQTSGIPDINGLADYDAVLQRHQTPRSLIDKIIKLPAEHAPGIYKSEEHSAYNLLALIIEQESGLPFASAIKRLVFDPLQMRNSGIDDDRFVTSQGMARGHAPTGLLAVEPARAIHWSAKAGNASAYTTANDHLRFVQGLFNPKFLDPALRAALFDASSRVGYGWFKNHSTRFNEPVYSMNGRAPGFSSAVVYLPRERLFIVALSNIYASFTPDIATNVAAIALGRPYEPLALKTSTDQASLSGLPVRFRFNKDFYQPAAVVRLVADSGEVTLKWPSGETSPLIPTATDHYIDRSYGVAVELIRDAQGRPTALNYDRFVGELIDGKSHG